MDVVLREEVRIEVVLLRLASQEGRGSFGAFLHDVAEGSGELYGSLALHDGGFNGQNLAAGLGPGKAVAHAGTQRHAVFVIEEDRRTEQFEKVIGLHLKGRLFSGGQVQIEPGIAHFDNTAQNEIQDPQHDCR